MTKARSSTDTLSGTLLGSHRLDSTRPIFRGWKRSTRKNTRFAMITGLNLRFSAGVSETIDVNNEKNILITFHYTGCLIGIPIIGTLKKTYTKRVAQTPYTIQPKQQVFLHCSK